ncbi:hypothetical protein Tco_0738013 [Tanacetum coccineum]
MNIESILCPLCEKNVESSSHIFFTCPISREIFRKVLLWWEIDVVMVSSYDEWLEWLLSIRSKFKGPFLPTPIVDNHSLAQVLHLIKDGGDVWNFYGYLKIGKGVV